MNAYTNAPASDTTTAPCLPIKMPVFLSKRYVKRRNRERDSQILALLQTSRSVRDAARKSGLSYPTVRQVALDFGLFGRENGWRQKPAPTPESIESTKALMRESGITQVDVAKRLGITRQAVSLALLPHTPYSQESVDRIAETVRHIYFERVADSIGHQEAGE